MVDSVECGTYIEQGQESDLRFIEAGLLTQSYASIQTIED